MNPTDVAERTPVPPLTDSKPESAASKTFDAPVPEEQKPSALLVRAQQFLHGQGVEQNCEQGLLYLRAAAQKNEPAAAVQMGALYASGRCVHQDRVMAYRWFNSAHELEPANQWIQRNMDLLWGQMSDQERRLAGY
jgi:TPR repeat protein